MALQDPPEGMPQERDGQHGDGCYHCGLPVPPGVVLTVAIEGQVRAMCCAGCQAVAQAIVGNGLADYYRHRDALPENLGGREAMPEALRDLGLFDLPEVQKEWVRPMTGSDGQVSGQAREVSLILEGITCAACVWLNETHLARQPGVIRVEINYATRRARLCWDERETRLSRLIAAIAAIGYRAHPYDPAVLDQLAGKERRTALWRLFVAGFGMMQVMMYAVPVYLAGAGEMTPDIEQLMRWASLVLTLPVMGYSAAPFFRSAWRDLGQRRLGMDVPVALGIGAAFAASCWATLTAAGEVYFDSVTMFVFFLLLGRYFELMARQRALRGVEERTRALPLFASRLTAFPSLNDERVAVAQLAAGDLVLVRPGETLPVDGRVVQGESAADESLLTGESRSCPKTVGDTVTGGSLNVGSPLVVRVEQVGQQTRLATIQQLVERAATEKPQLLALADRIAAHFVRVLIVLAVVTALAWYFVDPARMLWVFVAVLVVSCPCALSLATPAAMSVAIGTLSRLGVLVTRGHAIETLARVDHFVFDKTGTLTEGRLALVAVLPLGTPAEPELLHLAATLEQASEHPMGRALCRAAEEGGGSSTALPETLEMVKAVTGQGIEARLSGRCLRVGTLPFVAALHGQELPPLAGCWRAAALQEAGSVIALGDEQGWLGLFHLADQVRAETPALLAELRALGIRVSMLSGDAAETVVAVAGRLGIAEARGGLSPEEKHDCLEQWQAAGQVVAMVGDGVNDAPVLARAQVSVAVGGAADLAQKSADIVLLGADIRALATAVRFARRTLRIIRQNLWWAFFYNLSAIPLAMLGFVTPWMAGIGMSSSSLLVVLNALRLQSAGRFRGTE